MVHELGVTKELVTMVLAECERNKVSGLSKVVLELGALTTYTSESVRFYFDMLKQDHPVLKNAELEVREVPATITCSECGQETQVTDPLALMCPLCGSGLVEIVGGKDFILKEIEVDDHV